jgi:hypothetical protein
MELHAFPDVRSNALHQLAAAQQWSVDAVLDWAALSLDRIPSAMRRAMAGVYGDVLYAEEFGLTLAKRIVERAPEGWQRDLAQQQLCDELRHVDFFTRLTKLLGEGAQPSEELSVLRDELARTRDYDELRLQAQVLETAARALFIGNAARSLQVLDGSIRLPGSDSVRAIMRVMLNYVGRDESRHLAIGHYCLKRRLRTADAAERHGFEARVRVSARLMHRSFVRRAPLFAKLGLSSDDVLRSSWDALHKQLGRLELELGEAEPA